jgi:phytanoyl-CoA hydroxylase
VNTQRHIEESMSFSAEVSSDITAFYSENGFVVITGVFSESECESAVDAIERAAAVRSRVTDPYFMRLDTENSFNTHYRQFANLHEQDADLKAFAHSEKLGALASTAAASNLRFLFSSMLEKRAFAGPLRAHHDLRQMPFESEGMITAWIALDDVDARNGCLYYLPGTQQMGVARAKDSAMASFKESSIDYMSFYSEYDKVEPVFAEVTVGTVLLHNGMTIHGSGANLSRSSRRAFSVSYVPEDTVCLNEEHPLLRGQVNGTRFAKNVLHPRA